MLYRALFFLLVLPALGFSYTVVRNDGKIFSGTLIEQSETVTVIRDDQGITIRFRADQIRGNQIVIADSGSFLNSADGTNQPDVPEHEATAKSSTRWTGQPMSFDFKAIDIADLFRFMADISGLNIILDPSVKGAVSLKLTDVPWDQAFDLIAKNQGLGYTVEGNVIRVVPYAKLAQEARVRSDAQAQQMMNGSLITEIIPLNYAKATEMDKLVKKLLSPRGSSIADARTNTLIVTDIEPNMRAIMALLGKPY
jgi:type II secretory pathway component HofQ